MKSSAQNMPTINVSRTRKAIMNSLTLKLYDYPARDDAEDVSKVESSTKNSEMPSIPM